MPHSETTQPDGTITHKFGTDEELAIVAEGELAKGESLEHAMGRFLGYTASGTYVFSDPPKVKK